MLEALAVGDRFKLSLSDLNRPPAATVARQATPPNFLEVEARHYHLGDPAPQLPPQPDAGPVDAGNHATQARNFIWLPWIPGKVSYTQVPVGSTIVTGLMTGCWLVLFTLGGQTCFGHIGTEAGPNTAASLEAKNSWKVAANHRKITPIRAFKPLSTIGDATFGALGKDGHGYMIGASRELNGCFKVMSLVRIAEQASPLLS